MLLQNTDEAHPSSTSNEVPNTDYDLSVPLPSDAPGLRSALPSYGDPHFALFLRKVFIKSLGFTESALSKPIVGIINTYSAFNPCHAHVPQLIEACKRGILSSGGLPMEFPTISIGETFSSPTSMYLRNLMSMDTEEMIRAQPCDAVVAIGGCDKTVPAQLMGALSANKPFLPLVTGPMMPGSVNGVRVGACTDCRSHWAKYRAGEIELEDIIAVNEELAPTGGTCGVMGTASTMACIVAALGLTDLRSGASAPAVSSSRLRVAESTGTHAVAMLTTQSKKLSMSPQNLLTKENFLNAITVLQAIGGSTNAVVHLLAIIGRHESPDVRSITIDKIDDIGRRTPLLIDLKPSGEGYMTDFHNGGGMLALLHTLRPSGLLHENARTYTGQTLGELLDATPSKPLNHPGLVLRSLSNPLYPCSSLVVLKGNLAPNGCIMKASASKNRKLLSHTGPACVFKNSKDLALRIDDPNLNVTKDSVLVLQGIGPVGNPGMPEAGLIPIPRKLSSQGVSDMLRVSDGRMSGTAGGTVVLHVDPESANPESVLGIVEDGDNITIDVESRILKVDIDDEEIKRRIQLRKQRMIGDGNGGDPATQPHVSNPNGRENIWADRERQASRGYRGLYERHVNQAHLGCDFDFLRAKD